MNTNSSNNLKCIWDCKCELGEGIIWVKEHNSVYFTDIKKKIIFKYNLDSKKKIKYRFNKQIGFISYIKKDLFLLGMERELRIVNLSKKKLLNQSLLKMISYITG